MKGFNIPILLLMSRKKVEEMEAMISESLESYYVVKGW